MENNRPNILVITTHDSGRWFGCYDRTTIQTLAIDALAGEGVRLSNCFCTSPICSASRASMMTGRYPQSHGLLDLAMKGFDYEMLDEAPHLSQILRGAGYETLLFGLQHETQFPQTRLAFDQMRAGREGEGGGRHRTCDAVAADVAAFLTKEARADRPFYAQIGFYETHTSWGFGGVQPDDSKGVDVPSYIRDDEDARRTCAALQGALRKADQGVGIILEALAQSGLEERTLVIFTTDHGVELPRAKWFLYDPGMEVATILRWPGGGVSGGRTCDWLLSHVDLTPTILDLAGVTPPAGMDGMSYAAGLRGEENARPIRDAVFGYFQKSEKRCVRTSDYRLIRNFNPMTVALLGGAGRRCPDVAEAKVKGLRSPVELYDLAKDPREFENMAEDPAYAAVRAELDGRLWQWMEGVNDPILQGPTRTPFYEKSITAYQQWKSGT
jgi:arylsulfatase A-like enzyme